MALLTSAITVLKSLPPLLPHSGDGCCVPYSPVRFFAREGPRNRTASLQRDSGDIRQTWDQRKLAGLLILSEELAYAVGNLIPNPPKDE